MVGISTVGRNSSGLNMNQRGVEAGSVPAFSRVAGDGDELEMRRRSNQEILSKEAGECCDLLSRLLIMGLYFFH